MCILHTYNVYRGKDEIDRIPDINIGYTVNSAERIQRVFVWIFKTKIFYVFVIMGVCERTDTPYSYKISRSEYNKHRFTVPVYIAMLLIGSANEMDYHNGL